MAWIESNEEIASHPKTRKLARALGVSIPTAIGHLHLLWWWCLHYAPDGRLSGFDPEDVAEAAMWEGDPSAFIDALVSCGSKGSSGFLDRDDEGELSVHDWEDYTGRLLAIRAGARKRMARRRERYANGGKDASDVAPEDRERDRDVPEKIPNVAPRDSERDAGETEESSEGYANGDDTGTARSDDGSRTLRYECANRTRTFGVDRTGPDRTGQKPSAIADGDAGTAPEDGTAEPPPAFEASGPRTLELLPPPAASLPGGGEKRPRAEPGALGRAFAAFWDAYPRKCNKAAARKAFERHFSGLGRDEANRRFGVLATLLDRDRQGWTDPKYTPHGATWLNAQDLTGPPEADAASPGAPDGALVPLEDFA
jgi:hypothetical protein